MGDYFYKYIFVDHSDEINRKVVAQCEYEEDMKKYQEEFKDNKHIKMYVLVGDNK